MIRGVSIEADSSVSRSRAINSLYEKMNNWLQLNHIPDDHVIDIHFDINTTYKTVSSITGVKTCTYSILAQITYREPEDIAIPNPDPKATKKKLPWYKRLWLWITRKKKAH